MSDSPPPRQPADNLTGGALVLLQFALIGVIAWRAGPSFLALQASTLAWAPIFPSVPIPISTVASTARDDITASAGGVCVPSATAFAIAPSQSGSRDAGMSGTRRMPGRMGSGHSGGAGGTTAGTASAICARCRRCRAIPRAPGSMAASASG